MSYFGDVKYFRQVFGVLICLLAISGAVFSQDGEKPAEKNESLNQTEKTETKTRENEQNFQPFAAKTERSATQGFFGNRIGNSEKTNELVSENFAARRFNDFSATEKRTTERFSFSGRTETLRKSSSEKSDESDESAETPQAAQNGDSKKLRFGGHAGFVVPVYGYGNGTYSRFYDDFTFGFPVGLTLKPKGPVAIDFEFIFLSAASPNNRRFVLVIHPGVIYGFKKHYAIGIRAAYEANNNDAYGFTPLIARSFKLTEKLNHFIEFDFPVRWNKRTVRVGGQNFNDRFLSGAWAVHYGVSF